LRILNFKRARRPYAQTSRSRVGNKNGDVVVLQLRRVVIESEDTHQYKYGMKPEEIETADYDIRDALSDGFIGWLNEKSVMKRSDWKYDDLKSMNIDEFRYYCLVPPAIRRANRVATSRHKNKRVMASPLEQLALEQTERVQYGQRSPRLEAESHGQFRP
jgi:hypothetical protein